MVMKRKSLKNIFNEKTTPKIQSRRKFTRGDNYNNLPTNSTFEIRLILIANPCYAQKIIENKI
jgi:hypothetical protein